MSEAYANNDDNFEEDSCDTLVTNISYRKDNCSMWGQR